MAEIDFSSGEEKLLFFTVVRKFWGLKQIKGIAARGPIGLFVNCKRVDIYFEFYVSKKASQLLLYHFECRLTWISVN